MTATDELRRLLDERGVEYSTHGEKHGTWYDTPLGGHVYVAENNAGYLHVRSDAMTPEQAIAATLGRGECHIEEDEDTGFLCCSECGAIQPEDFTVYFCWCCGAKVVEK